MRPLRPVSVLASLRSALVSSLPPLDEDGQQISLALYRAIAKGRAVDLDVLGETLGIAEVRAVVDDWPAVHRNSDGAVIGYWGLALGGTAHRIVVRGVELTTWCAWDTLFLPELLDAEIQVESLCPETGKTVRLRLDPGGISHTDPESPFLSLLDPTGKVGDGVIRNFCNHVHFFADQSAAERWREGRTDAVLLTLPEGWALATEANHARYPSLCARRPRSSISD